MKSKVVMPSFIDERGERERPSRNSKEKWKRWKKRKKNWLGHCMRNECLMKTVMEGTIKGKIGRGRKRHTMLDIIKIKGKYSETKRLAEDREAWRLP
ncbi:hypothetical protein J437_LFUL007891 [Ladona fulva]|uniref:Uncharacterized protein n=1 Tax=Ladona fulva TaxID=123851 RepID=A0A8K0P177_LADFU|nr:hypothetical protein J437_LFUL007891 [Ladona fulva]